MIIPTRRTRINSKQKSGHLFCIEENIILFPLVYIFSLCLHKRNMLKPTTALEEEQKFLKKKITGKKGLDFPFYCRD